MSKEQINFYVFESKMKDEEKEKSFKISRPNMAQQREGQKVYNRSFSDAISSGALLRAKLDDFMKQQNMWDEEKQRELEEISSKIVKLEKSLLEGGIKLNTAKNNALELRRARIEMRELIQSRTDLDVHTAEGQADNARFNYWVSSCLVYNETNKPVFKDVDDYINNQNEDYAVEAAQKLASLLYNLSDNYENELTENEFLREFGFANDKNFLINEDGKLVDELGRLIDEEGYFVNKDGKRQDLDGNPVDEKGNVIIKRKPFLDDKGKSIKKEVKKETEETEEVETETVDS